MTDHNFEDCPVMLYWELTRSCQLSCRHCRAEAIKQRNPFELSTEECRKVIRDMKDFLPKTPHLVLTGGDPLQREDFFEILDYAISQGFPVSVAPSGTYALSAEVLKRFKDMGVKAISLSVDGSTAKKHNAFRGEESCFEQTEKAASIAKEINLPFQINTLVCSETKEDLPGIFEVIKSWGAMRWSVFFLIPVGRGNDLKAISPFETETTIKWLYQLGKKSDFAIKTTEALHYRRIYLQEMQKEGKTPEEIRRSPFVRGLGIRDGNGIMFLDHIGYVYPSGFLPVKAGNVRTRNIADIYRNSTIFREIREPDNFLGKCGYCEFNNICGGSRARAYAVSGNYLGSDTYCSYKPEKANPKEKILI